MEREDIASEAARIMVRANETNASPDEVLSILAVVMGQLLHEHAADAFAAGQVLVAHNSRAIEYYANAKRHEERVVH
jgi:hypothetical protein